MELLDVVMKLNGPINAVGESHTDKKRKENLVNLCNLVEALLFEISKATSTANRVESSMKDIGGYAKGFLKEVCAAYKPD